MDAAGIPSSLLQELSPDGDLARGARAYIQRGRSLLLERHRAGAGGAAIVSTYTTMVDHLICHLFEVASRDFISRYPSLNPRCTLVAQGGYGRRELNPYSDIDLLFLHTWKPNSYVESVTEKILYTLWDAGLQVGHATRSVAESIRLAGRDMKVKTALIDGRYLCGDAALYADLAKAVEEGLLKKSRDRFVREKLDENRLRHERYGGSVYLLEPDIKDGEGGLRDIQTAFWIAKVKHFFKDLDDLQLHGILQPRDLAGLKEAQDFLWRVRNELHFSTGKHQDQLTFEQQEKVARALGFKDEGGLKAVEAFMRSYYLRAAEVNRITSLIIHRAIDGSVPAQVKTRPVGREIREGVRVARGVLWVSDPEIFRRDPKNLINVFADAQRCRATLSQETRELIREHLGLIDERTRRTPEVGAIFLGILKWKARVYEALSEMHRCGVLGALIPEFGRLLCMVLHDLYHIYTVDQHSLHLVMKIERLRAGELRDALPLLTQSAQEVEKIEVLYLSLLFHDIGKGYGGGHSERGARMAMRIARRFRLNADETAQLVFLV
ncbi:MAG: [protein-PII] uridylyltransferase, partial [Deltaproteobacteria bacterium]|nr:[protein-PII] uridylyltransferase [Deltaproteobacteria bacterium]